MSGPRMGMPQMNGSTRRPPNLTRMPSGERPVCAQHDDLIKYIYDSWSKVSQEMDRNSGNSVVYYREDNRNLKDFEPFDLDAYWERREIQSIQHSHRT